MFPPHLPGPIHVYIIVNVLETIFFAMIEPSNLSIF